INRTFTLLLSSILHGNCKASSNILPSRLVRAISEFASPTITEDELAKRVAKCQLRAVCLRRNEPL
ncbi:unnamed protein product, partial [Linum tenue]